MLAGNIPGKTQTMPLAIYEAVVSGEDKRGADSRLEYWTGASVAAVYFTKQAQQGGDQILASLYCK